MHQGDYSVETESIERRQAVSTYRHIASTISCTSSTTVMLTLKWHSHYSKILLILSFSAPDHLYEILEALFLVFTNKSQIVSVCCLELSREYTAI